MYDGVGDATAYNLVRMHFDAMGKVVADHHGAIVKTVGDSVMATFVRPGDAVSAGLAMLESRCLVGGVTEKLGRGPGDEYPVSGAARPGR